jgi:hypothetical protein
MIRTSLLALVCLGCFLYSFATSQEGKKFTVKSADTPTPKELSEPLRKLLSDSSIQLVDEAGKAVCDIWLRKEIPADATPQQIKSGVTYREIKQTELFGAIQFHTNWSDYRKQKIKAGVYTMRLAYQPTDGKHTADISEFQDFILLVGAKFDAKPALMDPKMLSEASGDSIESAHPAVFMLWPNSKPGKEPELVARPKQHQILNASAELTVAGKATGTRFGIGLTLVGYSPAE